MVFFSLFAVAVVVVFAFFSCKTRVANIQNLALPIILLKIFRSSRFDVTALCFNTFPQNVLSDNTHALFVPDWLLHMLGSQGNLFFTCVYFLLIHFCFY